jgi:hypothetical protein
MDLIRRLYMDGYTYASWIKDLAYHVWAETQQKPFVHHVWRYDITTKRKELVNVMVAEKDLDKEHYDDLEYFHRDM